jgi:hypothetical protein
MKRYLLSSSEIGRWSLSTRLDLADSPVTVRPAWPEGFLRDVAFVPSQDLGEAVQAFMMYRDGTLTNEELFS